MTYAQHQRELRGEPVSPFVVAAQASALSTRELAVLSLLRQRPMTVGRLSAAINAPKPSMTRVTASLMRLGFVQRKPGRDLRIPWLSLTSMGDDFIHRLHEGVCWK